MTDHDTGYWVIGLLLQRGFGFIYLMAFLVALNQFRPGACPLYPSNRAATDHQHLHRITRPH